MPMYHLQPLSPWKYTLNGELVRKICLVMFDYEGW